jgi:GT2 family glycosyltransferase
MTEAADITVIVPTFNARRAVEDCVRSVLAQSGVRLDVIVIDDASADGTAAMIRERFPSVRLIANPHNLGYGRACNLGLASARGRAVLLLNNDTVLDDGALRHLLESLLALPQADAVGCLLLNTDGSVQTNTAKAFPTWRTPLFGYRSPLSRWFPRNRFSRRELLTWKADEGRVFEADFVSSAALLMRTDALRALGGLDPAFFHFIDADLCRRIRDAGGRVHCDSRARAMHLEHGGGSMVTPRRRFRTILDFHLGAYRYFAKHSAHSRNPVVRGGVIAALAARWAASSGLQAARELGSALTGARRASSR